MVCSRGVGNLAGLHLGSFLGVRRNRARPRARAVVAVAFGLAALIINEEFFGLTAKDLMNNRPLYPIYDRERYGLAMAA